MRSAWIGGVLCVVGSVGGVLTLDPLPPEVSFVFLVPLVVAGIGLILQSTAGRGLGALGSLVAAESWIHVPLVLLGWSLIGVGTTGLLKLPSAATVQVARLSSTLPSFCRDAPGTRVERELLPTLEALDRRLLAAAGPTRDAAHAALRDVLPRCVEHLSVALDDPQGTHASWGMLREWLIAHPALVALPERVATAPLRPRQHRPRRPPVRLDL